MATVQSMNLARLLDLEADTVIGGHIDGSGDLILEQHDGSEINAGSVLATVPDASETVKGIVELASVAEANTGTDTVRAVTPAGLARIITPTAEADPSTSYPLGISMFSITTGSGWSLNGGVGMVLTHNISTARCHQTFHINGGTGIVPRRFARGYNSGSGGWSSWHEMYMGPLTIMSLVYPVGSIYIATVSTNPATLLGIGTWAAFGAGRMLISQNGSFPAGNTGGASTVTIAETNLPAHTHSDGSLATGGGGTHTHSIGRDQDGATGSVERVLHSTGISGAEQVFSGQLTSDGDHTHDVTGSTGSTGSGTALNVMNPWISVYMWQRTA